MGRLQGVGTAHRSHGVECSSLGPDSAKELKGGNGNQNPIGESHAVGHLEWNSNSAAAHIQLTSTNQANQSTNQAEAFPFPPAVLEVLPQDHGCALEEGQWCKHDG